MYRKIFFAIILILILLSRYVTAATIYGNVYDYSLEKIDNVKITIDTQPIQKYVSKNGTYSFNVPLGDYVIRAEEFKDDALSSYIEENISVIDNGEYVLDLILFPSFDDENELIEEEIGEINGLDEEMDYNLILIFTVIILFFAVIIYTVYFFFLKKHKLHDGDKEEDIDLERIMQIIKKEGGRTTQKEIRKQIPLSEAKICLMIAELEESGKIKKIKKGRGNIIILCK